MPTLIDESGDTGPCSDLAHCYFRLAAVWVPSHDEVESIREEIRGVRAALQLRADYEFKFSKTWNYPDRRDAFFRAAIRRDFRFAFVSIDKTHPYWREADKQTIHWAAVTDLAATLRPIYLSAHEKRVRNGGSGSHSELILVDDNEDYQFLTTVKQQFRGLGKNCDLGHSLVGKVRFQNSCPDELIQLADMVCGAAGANLSGKRDWYQIIAERDLDAPRRRKKAGELWNSPLLEIHIAQGSA